MSDPYIDIYLAKADESLAGAASEYVNGRYNNCANRAYYACLQAAVAALMRAGIVPPGPRAEWSHAFVQAQFVTQLIDRRKLYSSTLRDVLHRGFVLRRTADYETEQVSQARAERTLRRARTLVEAIRA